MGDAHDMLSYSSDPLVCQYLAWPPHKHISDSQRYIADRIAEWKAGTRWTYAITAKPDPKMIGHIRLTPQDDSIRLGYALASTYAGRGITTVAVKSIVKATEHLTSAWRAYCDTENIASIKVLEKGGFECIQLLGASTVFPNRSDSPRDCYVFERKCSL